MLKGVITVWLGAEDQKAISTQPQQPCRQLIVGAV